MTSYFHPHVKVRLDTFNKNLPQSLLFHGANGIGLMTAAHYIAEHHQTPLMTVLPEKDERVDLEKGVISVASIRRLYDMTKTIEVGRRIIVIDYAERMGIQAQNAFLKLLEEPGKNTHFILLTHEPGRLLPTITSRVSSLEIRPIPLKDSEEVLAMLGVKDATKRAQLLFIAGGLPAELTRLAQDQAYFDARSQIVRDARNYLQGTAYDRLVMAQRYKDSRGQALTLLDDAMKLIKQNVESGKTGLLPNLEKLLNARTRIEANGNVRLQLAAAMV